MSYPYPNRKQGESFEDWKKRCFGIETLEDFKRRIANYGKPKESVTDESSCEPKS